MNIDQYWVCLCVNIGLHKLSVIRRVSVCWVDRSLKSGRHRLSYISP